MIISNNDDSCAGEGAWFGYLVSGRVSALSYRGLCTLCKLYVLRACILRFDLERSQFIWGAVVRCLS